MSSAPTSAPAPTRPSSRGAFELHVQSVRATGGLPHLIQTPTYAVHTTVLSPTSPAYAYSSEDEEKKHSSFDDDVASVRTAVETKAEKSNRTTSDDGPEPNTLARMLFRYGFLMPIFWLFGASILFLGLSYHQTPEELAEDARTKEEKIADLHVLRAAEVRWAWRSFYALVLLILSVSITLLIWAGATGRFTGIH